MHLIFDMETLAVRERHKAIALDISFFAFDPRRFTSEPYTFSEILNSAVRLKYSIVDQKKNHGFVSDPETVQFWNSQDEELKKKILFIKPTDLTLDEVFDIFIQYAEDHRVKQWWTRSNIFDPIVMEGHAEALGKFDRFKNTLQYNMVRDMRSYIEGYFGFNVDNKFVPTASDEVDMFNRRFVEHDSTHDIVADILRIQCIERARAGLDEAKIF